MWKNGREEQNFLEKLFREKTVNCTMKPSEVQRNYPKFAGFTATTFRKHWNAKKMMFAAITMKFSLDFLAQTFIHDFLIVPGDRNNCADDDIIEIDGLEKAPKLSLDDDISTVNISFKRPPIVVTVYADPETKQDICLVILSLHSKVKKIDFDVVTVDNNHILKVTRLAHLFVPLLRNV